MFIQSRRVDHLASIAAGLMVMVCGVGHASGAVNPPPPQRLDVTYSQPQVVAGPVSAGLDELPDEVHAQFILEGIGTTPGSTAALGNVESALVEFGDGQWTESELLSFEMGLGDGGEIVTLNWAMDAILTQTVLEGLTLNNDFELTITGTDRASGEPFEYSYPQSMQMLTQVPEPASLVLLALSALALGCRRHREPA